MILVSETWRSKEEEIWESIQGHIVTGAGKHDKKHGVAILVNKRWKHRINWTKFISECHCSVGHNQQATDYSVERVHAT